MNRREFVAILGGAAAAWPLEVLAQPDDRVRALQLRVLRLHVEAAADKIANFIIGIESQIGFTTQLPWSAATLDQRRFDALRLLRQAPGIATLSQLDSAGIEQLKVSRAAIDVAASKTDYSHDPKFTEALIKKVYYGPVYFSPSGPVYSPRPAPCEAGNSDVGKSDVLSGVGLYLTLVDNRIRVVALMDNMPAAKAGIMAGDTVVALDDEPLRGLTLNQVVERIRGPASTGIKLTLLRVGRDTPIEFSVTRDVIRENPRVNRCPPVSQAESAGAAPHMTISLAGTGREADVSVAEINLKLVQDVVSKMEVGEHGAAYVVDSQNRVIAHRNPGSVNADFSSHTEVQAARAAPGAASAGFVQDINGREMLAASIAIARLGWLVFAELPAEEADVLAR